MSTSRRGAKSNLQFRAHRPLYRVQCIIETERNIETGLSEREPKDKCESLRIYDAPFRSLTSIRPEKVSSPPPFPLAIVSGSSTKGLCTSYGALSPRPSDWPFFCHRCRCVAGVPIRFERKRIKWPFFREKISRLTNPSSARYQKQQQRHLACGTFYCSSLR